jgi:DNA polymerase I-like protein with 3'-5' exonuclease and polymerase domains
MVEVERWATPLPFNPGSTKDVQAYLKLKGYQVPKHRKTKRPTVNAEAINRLRYKFPTDPVLKALKEAKDLKDGVGAFKDTFVGRDGRFHPRYTIVKTGRLASKAPNVMNIPQGREGPGSVAYEVAQAVRSTIIPEEGWFFQERDWKAIEALLVGYFAEDPLYMEAARKGVHDIFASHLLYRDGIIPKPIHPQDPKLPEFIEWLKANHNDVRARAKKRIHGGSYGQGIYNMALDLGVSVAEVKRLDLIYEEMAPKVKKWQETVRLMAHTEGKLTNPFGYSLSFFEVFRKEGEKWVLGKEANEALSCLPQGTCAAMLRECLVDLSNHPLHGKIFWLLIPTHDAITTMVKMGCGQEAGGIVRASMERQWPQLGGLMVETDAKEGISLGEMH